ncbi:MAG: DUF1700 domain-containing protein, partial [Eggerthellaceae bacterium]|nr:DUF1700 domain-containing protein [Eggerthellaceae bacterium]
MNKVEFLDALHRRIDMLDDAEVSDILNEYSLHIECKVQCGMTEEEAVADFGDVGELAADVLSAYHVKAPAEPVAAVASAQSDKESSSTGPASELEHNAGAVKAAWGYLCSLCKRGVQGVRDWCSRCLRACKSVGDRLFSRRCKADDALGVDPYAADVDSSAPSVEAVAAGVGAAAGPLPAADPGRP